MTRPLGDPMRFNDHRQPPETDWFQDDPEDGEYLAWADYVERRAEELAREVPAEQVKTQGEAA